ncbi:uncharacterized protein L3040_000790 [Drepanopeziza brunnea f. sp. 'multigermtubi']|uniref:uncharacterized protein n=1 Tax=Drepanopeziza brunnea f. sp. 'multigermtubi' TaxID=698441 RepID=UPI0023997ED6|nr:hypothetical protein L3040_000790 [Drepanopeziza brunnea f. sp. 'multigermtubi']
MSTDRLTDLNLAKLRVEGSAQSNAPVRDQVSVVIQPTGRSGWSLYGGPPCIDAIPENVLAQIWGFYAAEGLDDARRTEAHFKVEVRNADPSIVERYPLPSDFDVQRIPEMFALLEVLQTRFICDKHYARGDPSYAYIELIFSPEADCRVAWEFGCHCVSDASSERPHSSSSESLSSEARHAAASEWTTASELRQMTRFSQLEAEQKRRYMKSRPMEGSFLTTESSSDTEDDSATFPAQPAHLSSAAPKRCNMTNARSNSAAEAGQLRNVSLRMKNVSLQGRVTESDPCWPDLTDVVPRRILDSMYDCFSPPHAHLDPAVKYSIELTFPLTRRADAEHYAEKIPKQVLRTVYDFCKDNIKPDEDLPTGPILGGHQGNAHDRGLDPSRLVKFRCEPQKPDQVVVMLDFDRPATDM